MLPGTYFRTYGEIYADRSRFLGPGKGWYHEFHRFVSLERAVKWKKEKDFGYKRELLSKNEAKLRGMNLVKKNYTTIY